MPAPKTFYKAQQKHPAQGRVFEQRNVFNEA